MTKFLNGPTAGQVLMIRRAPVFLRVTEQGGIFDALDQVTDVPHKDEKLHAYVMKKFHGNIHIMARGGRSGLWPQAEYELFEPQPEDAQMRNYDEWRAWCEANAPQKGF